jgi:hypothetical protein
VLYGVTMQEHGVSRIVSVRFHKADEQVTDHKPVQLEGEENGKREEPEVMMAK